MKFRIKDIFIFPIHLYQKTLSADHGWLKYSHGHRKCKYYPSCSQYCIDALEEKGIFLGIILGIWRILRCNPWSKGGIDPVKNNQKKL